MAPPKQRSKVCKNCRYVFVPQQPDVFCPCCGQENSEQLVSLGRFIMDFINQYVAFDSKIAKTLFSLIVKPGFLSREYCAGKVVSYILPLRVYLLMSLVYFTIFAAKIASFVDKTSDVLKMETPSFADTTSSPLLNLKDSILLENDVEPNALVFSPNAKINFKRAITLADKYPLTQTIDSLKAEYPFLQESLLMSTVVKQGVKLYQTRGKDLVHYFLGAIPVMMLLLMPLLALFYKLLYIRRKRYFIEHLTFFLHYHAFVYVMLSFYILIWGFNGQWLSYLVFVITIYLLLAMKKMYEQSWLKTGLKQLIFMLFGYPLFISEIGRASCRERV